MTSLDRFDHPLTGRYASDEMQRLFSNGNRYTTWRRLWLALASAQKDLGLEIPDDALEQMRRGKIKLAPPTVRTLQWLASFDDAAAVLDAADPVGDHREVAAPRRIAELLLVLHAERAVVGRHDLQIIEAQAAPQGVLAILVP